ncbi:hypothetical protein [Paraburkholderia heleia]|uniref:hypothetical protein n=1 Tax=Paraburkholderia heleia TaxID=634127 RepID=UPI002AB5EF90|nr:hypothetical protein [Paraburkholderia heleia]
MEQTNETQDEQATALVDEAAVKEAKAKISKTTADLMTRPSFMAAHTAMNFVPQSLRAYGEPGLKEMFEAHRDEVAKVIDGDMRGPEAMLMSQALSLNAAYNYLADLMVTNLGKNVHHGEALMRMALRAQAQSAQAIRFLGELKNPRQTTFVKQQNNANQQQVNNGTAAAVPLAHADKSNETTTNELLTDEREAQDAATLDAGAKIGAGRENQTLETVGAVDGADE